MELEKRREFGKWLRSMRKQADLSLVKASEEIGYETKGTLSSVESGFTSLPIEQIHPVAETYNIDVNKILDKLFEYEHDLWAKYMRLAGDIIEEYEERRFAQMKADDDYVRQYLESKPKWKAMNRKGRRKAAAIERRAHHHLPFPGNGLVSDNNTYGDHVDRERFSALRGPDSIYYVNQNNLRATY